MFGGSYVSVVDHDPDLNPVTCEVKINRFFPDTCNISVADPDPGSGAFLTPGSGIRDE
jgi:hypothetical protein